MKHKIGLVLMFVSSLAIGFFVMMFLEGRILITADAFLVALILILVSFVALKWPIIGGVMGVLAALYPLAAALRGIVADDVYYIWYYVLAFSILLIIGSLMVIMTKKISP